MEKGPLPEFDGWETPRYTPIPDQLLDEWLPYLSEAELKVLLYIMRRTFGFKKNADAISLRQMAEGIVRRDGTRLDRGAGVSESSILRGLKGLKAKGLIEADTTQAPDGEYQTTIYRLRMHRPPSLVGPSPQIEGTGVVNLTEGVPPEQGIQDTASTRDSKTRGAEEGGPSLTAVLAGLGAQLGDRAWALGQAEAADLCVRRGWTAAALGVALAARSERTVRLRLRALAAG